MFASEWKSSPSAYVQPSDEASNTPTVDLPLPATPITTTAVGPMSQCVPCRACRRVPDLTARGSTVLLGASVFLGTQSNSPARTPARKAAHACSVTRSVGPPGRLDSLTATCPSTRATSTHVPVSQRLLRCHVPSVASTVVLRRSSARLQCYPTDAHVSMDIRPREMATSRRRSALVCRSVGEVAQCRSEQGACQNS